MTAADRQYRFATAEYGRLQKQKACPHPADRVLGPTRWTATSMCMACGKEFGTAVNPTAGDK